MHLLHLIVASFTFHSLKLSVRNLRYLSNKLMPIRIIISFLLNKSISVQSVFMQLRQFVYLEIKNSYCNGSLPFFFYFSGYYFEMFTRRRRFKIHFQLINILIKFDHSLVKFSPSFSMYCCYLCSRATF